MADRTPTEVIEDLREAVIGEQHTSSFRILVSDAHVLIAAHDAAKMMEALEPVKGIHTRYLKKGVVGDILNAEEDVPLIVDGYLTDAGTYYLESLDETYGEA